VFILTLRNDGLGDLVLALPTLSALRRLHPQARLGIVVRSDHRTLFDLYPDPVEVWDDGIDSRRRLWRERPDVLLFLRPDPGWARTAFLARVPRRIGTRHRWQSLFFNERVPVHRRNSGRHEAECNALVATVLGVTLPVEPVRLLVPPKARECAATLLAKAKGSLREGYVVVHPGSRGSSPNWPPERYAELVRLLAASGECVLVTAGPGEARLAREVAGPHGQALEPADLATLGAVLAGAGTVVSGSTGPMHLATALGTRVVALFSSRAPHSRERWGPLGGNAVVLEAAPVSRPEGGKDLSALSPHAVWNEVTSGAPGRVAP
jgi:ADP-heptose:LPS heptosyltransferase